MNILLIAPGCILSWRHLPYYRTFNFTILRPDQTTDCVSFRSRIDSSNLAFDHYLSNWVVGVRLFFLQGMGGWGFRWLDMVPTRRYPHVFIYTGIAPCYSPASAPFNSPGKDSCNIPTIAIAACNMHHATGCGSGEVMIMLALSSCCHRVIIGLSSTPIFTAGV